MHIIHGCGVGPMIALDGNGTMAVVSQLEKEKTVRVYKIEGVE